MLSSEPKAKEIDDEVSETSDSGVAAPARHVKMRARQDNGLRTPPWTPGTLSEGVGATGDHRYSRNVGWKHRAQARVSSVTTFGRSPKVNAALLPAGTGLRAAKGQPRGLVAISTPVRGST